MCGGGGMVVVGGGVVQVMSVFGMNLHSGLEWQVGPAPARRIRTQFDHCLTESGTNILARSPVGNTSPCRDTSPCRRPLRPALGPPCLTTARPSFGQLLESFLQMFDHRLTTVSPPLDPPFRLRARSPAGHWAGPRAGGAPRKAPPPCHHLARLAVSRLVTARSTPHLGAIETRTMT